MLVNNVPLLSLICKISESIGSLLITWDNGQRRMKFAVDKTENFQRKFDKLRKRCFLHSFTVLIVITQCLLGRDTSVSVKAQEIIAICIMQCLTSHLHVCRVKAEEMILYINGQFQFHDKYCHFGTSYSRDGHRKRMTLTERLIKLFALVFALTGLTFPSAVSGVHWMQPCTASLPGYWLLSECIRSDHETDYRTNILYEYSLVTIGTFAKVAVFLFSQWVWQFGVNASVFVNGALTALGTMGIRSHLIT